MSIDISKQPEPPAKKDVYAVISATFEGVKFESIPLLLSDDDKTESTQTVKYLTERGTSDLTMFKIPISASKFVIFSRQQLDKTLFFVEIGEHLSPEQKKSTKSSPRKVSK